MSKFVCLLVSLLLIGLTAGFQQPARGKKGFVSAGKSNAGTDSADASNKPSAWGRYASVKGAFSVRFPCVPEARSELMEFPVIGEADFHMFKATKDDEVYLVAWADLSTATKDKSKEFVAGLRQNILNYACETMSESVDGKKPGQAETSLNGHPGRECRIESSAGLVTTRIYVTDKRFYQVISIRPADKKDTAGADRFFSSFSITAE